MDLAILEILMAVFLLIMNMTLVFCLKMPVSISCLHCSTVELKVLRMLSRLEWLEGKTTKVECLLFLENNGSWSGDLWYWSDSLFQSNKFMNDPILPQIQFGLWNNIRVLQHSSIWVGAGLINRTFSRPPFPRLLVQVCYSVLGNGYSKMGNSLRNLNEKLVEL